MHAHTHTHTHTHTCTHARPSDADTPVQSVHSSSQGLFTLADTITTLRTRPAAATARSIANLCKDYCGVLTEESIRLNFVLIYELLDEVIDFGCVVHTLLRTLVLPVAAP